jgi:hypothetical protein
MDVEVMVKTLVRCFVFGVLGPSFGLLTSIAIGLGNAKDLSLDGLVIVLLAVYLNGLVPALITAAFDSYSDWKGARGILKWLLTGALGYGAAYLNIPLPVIILQPRWGLVGAIPAAICSAITEQIVSPEKCRRA